MNKTPKGPALEEVCPKESCDRAWSYYQHADNLAAGRSNFFLVAESMLIAGLFTLPREDRFLRVWLVGFAMVYTAGWWYVNARLQRRMGSLIPELKRDPLYVTYLESVRGISAGAILSRGLPGITMLFWAGVLLEALWNR